MKVICYLREAIGRLLVALFIEEKDLNVPFFHRKAFDLRGFISAHSLSASISPIGTLMDGRAYIFLCSVTSFT